MLGALGESRGEPPLDAARLPARIDWTASAQGCPELSALARSAVQSGAGARRAELRIEGACDHFDRRTSHGETEHWTELVERQSSTTQNVCRQVSEYKSQCKCVQRADINGSGMGTCISYEGCNESHTVCEPQTTTTSYTESIPHDDSYTVSERTVGASLRATAVVGFEGRTFQATFADGTSKNESSYQSHEHGSSSFSSASEQGLFDGYRSAFAGRVAGIVHDAELAAAAAVLAEASSKEPLAAEDLVVAASLVTGAAAASDSTLAPVAARYGISTALYTRFLGVDAPSFRPTFGGTADLLTPREDSDLVQQSQAHDQAVAEHREDDDFIEKMHGLHGSALLAGMLSAGPDDKNTGGASVGMGVRTSFGTRFFLPIDGTVRIGYDAGAKAWNTQETLLSGFGLRNTRVSGTLLGAFGISGFGKEESGRYYLPFGLDAGYGLETSLRLTGGHFIELQGLRLHRPKNERGAGAVPVQQVYRATVRYTYRSAESSSRGEYGALVECNFAYENATIIPDGGLRGRNCTAGFVLGF